MTIHKYAPEDIQQLKKAIGLLRTVQLGIENDVEEYQRLDNIMTSLEEIIDEFEGGIT